MTVAELDGLKRSFEIRVEGAFGDGTFWAHDRVLDISGGVLRAEGMTIAALSRSCWTPAS